MANIEYVSVDVGYGFTKAISSSGNRVIFPSVVGTGRDRNLASFLNESHITSEMDLSELHLKINGSDYFVGDLAIKNSPDGSRVFDRERFNHLYTYILLHVAIQLTVSPETDEVVLFTGLPLDYFKTQKDDFQRQLLNQQPLHIEWQTGFNRSKTSIRIMDCNVFPQGFSAVWATLLNHDGKEFNRDLLQEGNQIAVIDIGYRTTDVCVVEMQEGGGFTPIMQFSETIEQGVVNLHDAVKLSYQQKTNGSDLSENKLNRIFKQKNISFKGKKYDFTDEVAAAHQSVANAINDRVNMLWKGESDTFDEIFTVGGGGIVFSDFLQKNFDNRLKSIIDSQYSNAIGYYRIGKMLSGDIQQHRNRIAN